MTIPGLSGHKIGRQVQCHFRPRSTRPLPSQTEQQILLQACQPFSPEGVIKENDAYPTRPLCRAISNPPLITSELSW